MKHIFLFIIIFIFSFLAACAVEKADWTEVDSTNYINWDEVVGSDDVYGYTFMLKSFNKGQYEPVNGRKIWYTISQYTIDCSAQKYKIGVIDSFGYQNNFINGDYNRYAKFQPIINGTAIGIISQKLCRVK